MRKKTTLAKKSTGKNNTSKNHKSQIRIIGGQWRGRKLPVADVEGLRPTGDRIRETLFNWLQGDIQGARCLDLFAGTGTLGLEALSRYAREVVFIEKNKTATAQLKNIVELLKAENAQLIHGDALQWLMQQNHSSDPFDIIFLDPPFALDLWQQSLSLLTQNKLLKDNALLYLERPKDKPVELDNNFETLKEKTTGQVHYSLLRYHS